MSRPFTLCWAISSLAALAAAGAGPARADARDLARLIRWDEAKMVASVA